MDFIAPPAAKAADPAQATVFFDGGYAVNAASPNKEAALKLVNWMGTKEFGDKFTELLGNISPIKGVAINDPLLAEVAELNKTAMPISTSSISASRSRPVPNCCRPTSPR